MDSSSSSHKKQKISAKRSGRHSRKDDKKSDDDGFVYIFQQNQEDDLTDKEAVDEPIDTIEDTEVKENAAAEPASASSKSQTKATPLADTQQSDGQLAPPSMQYQASRPSMTQPRLDDASITPVAPITQDAPLAPFGLPADPKKAESPAFGSSPQPAPSLPPAPSGVGGGVAPQAGPSWLRSAHYHNAPNPGVQPLRSGPIGPQPGRPVAPPQPAMPNVLPHNPYAFINEQTLPDTNKGKGKVVVVIGAVLMGLLVAGTVVALSLSQGSDKPNQDVTNSSETEDSSGLSLSFSMMQPQYKDEVLVGAMAQQIVGSDGAVMMVTGIKSNYSDTDNGTSADSQLMRVDVLLGNADNSNPVVFERADFIIITTTGARVVSVEGANVGAETVALNPGMKGKLSLVYDTSMFTGDPVLLLSRSHSDAGIRYSMHSAVGLSQGTASVTSENVMQMIQSPGQ